VIEYKGADRIDTPEEREKEAIGEFWAQQSGGQCLFVMVTRRQFEAIRVKIRSV
jgi:type III restriction enzyme